MYYFLSGYTSKLAGTEVGLGKEPLATFEACFGAPFLPLPAVTYAMMLHDKLEQHHTQVYLLNTGWSGGPFGVGSRIGIGHTRTMVRAALAGTLDEMPSYLDQRFGFSVPQHIPGVPDELLNPRMTWSDPTAYDTTAGQLVERFLANFAKFGANAATIAAAGPRLIH